MFSQQNLKATLKQSSNGKSVEYSEEFLDMVSSKFKMLSETTRLKIIFSLQNGPLHVMEIVNSVGTTQANISKHLGLMYNAGVLGKRRQGNKLYYTISDNVILEMVNSLCKLSRNQIMKIATS